ncbi:MAG: hypothetical protein ACX930_11225 [Erythrobacter sp.]
MATSVSLYSLIAVVFYVVVALAAMAACGTASTSGQPRWNRNVWLALAILFVVLILLRGFGIEELVKDALRTELRTNDTYDERRQIQAIIASAIMAIVAAAGMLWLYRATRSLNGRRNLATMAGLLAGAAMVFLVILRLISLHMIDRALYGPFKLNWIVDLGASAVVLGTAIYYIRLVRARP